MPEINLDTRVTQAPDILTADVEEELVMLSLATDVYVALDAMAKRIWEALQGPITAAELCQSLLAEFEVLPETCQQDVLRLLNQLHEHQLIQIAPTPVG